MALQLRSIPQREPRSQGTQVALLGGTGAVTADQVDYVRARQMDEEGVDPNDIWQQTGWEKASDGQWRFEIDDSEASFVGGKFSHPELEAAYPDLFNEISVSVEDLPEDTRGVFNRDTNTVSVNSNLSDDKRVETVLHEFQHSIQTKEGFSEGSNPDNPIIEFMTATNPEFENSFDTYRSLAGEVEARNVAFRKANLNNKAKESARPSITEDVPRGQQLQFRFTPIPE